MIQRERFTCVASFLLLELAVCSAYSANSVCWESLNMANVDAFALLGLSEKQSEEAARNKQLAANVRTVTQTV